MSDIPPDIGAQLEALLNDPTGGLAYGADPYGVFTSTLADPTAQVFVGRQLQEAQPPGWGDIGPSPFSGRSRPRTGSPLELLPIPMETADAYRSAGDLLQDFYTMDAEELSGIQRLLYAGGWFGNVDILDVAWGQHDEETFSAWAQVVTRAARYNQAGVKKTPKQILEEAVAGGPGAGGRGPGSGGDRPVVSLSDPAGLRSTIDAVATNVLGRKATPDEQRMFVGVIHGMQRDGQLAAQQAQQQAPSGPTWDTDDDGSFSAEELQAALAEARADQWDGQGMIEVVQPSPEAQAEEQLRAANPTEAGAHDISNQFAQFTQLLRGVV